MSLRSGKFKSERTIITGRSSTFFRILNSAEFVSTAPSTNEIVIRFGNGAHDSIRVNPTFSVDFYASTDVSVTGPGVIEGIYDALPNEEIKSGRFKTRGSLNPTVGVDIIAAGSGGGSAVYRIFNSGTTPIQLKQKNLNGMGESNFKDPIPEGESLDFVTPNNKIICATGTGTVNDHIEGIYDFISKA